MGTLSVRISSGTVPAVRPNLTLYSTGVVPTDHLATASGSDKHGHALTTWCNHRRIGPVNVMEITMHVVAEVLSVHNSVTTRFC